ncbi:MAG TPA: metallophosphoesterase [Marmoricola sp.]
MSFGQHDDPTHVIAHLSDTHLRADTLQYGAVDTVANLERTLRKLRLIDPAPQALVLTGDLADIAEPGAYELLRKAIEPVAAEIGASVVWVMGNHDERETYSQALFGAASSEPQDTVHDVAGLRIIALDTSVPGWHHGELSADQLAWLREQLATPAEHGTILAMHHPPIAVPATPVAALIELHDQQALADAIAGSDVRAIIGGHFHYSSYSTFAGVPVSVASATCYTMDLAPDRRLISGVDGHQAFTLLHLYADHGDALHGGQVVHSIVPIGDAAEVTGEDIAMLGPLSELPREQQFDMVSRKDSPLYKGE